LALTPILVKVDGRGKSGFGCSKERERALLLDKSKLSKHIELSTVY